MIRHLAAFALAAVLEIAGCFGYWQWLRRGPSAWVACGATLSLVGFAVVFPRCDAGFAGRAYAAYGGVYIAASVAWLWFIEGLRPTVPDVAGAGIAVLGTM